MRFETSVMDIIVRANNVKSFRFPRPETLDYKAGQYMFITIKGGAGKLKKHFTISSSPSEMDFIEFTKKLTGSEFSSALNSLKAGDMVEISAPYGNFTFEGEYEKLGLLSGGIGITPLRSICKYCMDMKPKTMVTLLYGNHSEEDIIFRKELEEMQQQNSNLKVVFTLSEPGESWMGQKGRIDAGMIKREIPDYIERVFYICGPPAMVETMVSILEELEVPQNRIKQEEFTGY